MEEERRLVTAALRSWPQELPPGWAGSPRWSLGSGATLLLEAIHLQTSVCPAGVRLGAACPRRQTPGTAVLEGLRKGQGGRPCTGPEAAVQRPDLGRQAPREGPGLVRPRSLQVGPRHRGLWGSWWDEEPEQGRAGEGREGRERQTRKKKREGRGPRAGGGQERGGRARLDLSHLGRLADSGSPSPSSLTWGWGGGDSQSLRSTWYLPEAAPRIAS